jgi:UDP:flavonoid glycosyltransferase YjiC (YdhE family)
MTMINQVVIYNSKITIFLHENDFFTSSKFYEAIEDAIGNVLKHYDTLQIKQHGSLEFTEEMRKALSDRRKIARNEKDRRL